MKRVIDIRNKKCADTIGEKFKARHFDFYYAENKEQAKEIALSLIPKDHLVSWGGSVSIAEIGLKDALNEQGYNILDRDAYPPEQKQEIARKALTCDTYLMSANAITEDGMLVNIDGNGNRVAALIFGPKQVIVIAGMNKLTKDLDSAIKRARSTAAPINCHRFPNLQTPCNKIGTCADCLSPDSICAQMVITRLCKPQGRIKVIFVSENLGF